MSEAGNVPPEVEEIMGNHAECQDIRILTESFMVKK